MVRGRADDHRADAARRWARAWTTGWEALDPEPILACYAVDAVLSTAPFREAHRGLEAVREYVTDALGAEEDPRGWMSEPIVDADRASVSWWASLREDGADATLAGTSVLRFDAAGRVTEQWDAWDVIPERRVPSAAPVRSGKAAPDRSGRHRDRQLSRTRPTLSRMTATDVHTRRAGLWRNFVDNRLARLRGVPHHQHAPGARRSSSTADRPGASLARARSQPRRARDPAQMIRPRSGR